MKKISLIFAIFFIMFFSKDIYANFKFIKVGLTQSENTEKIHLDNQNILVGYGKDYNFFEKAKLSSAYGFDIKLIGNYYIKLSNIYHTYEEALNKSKEIANGFPMLEKDTWKIYIRNFNSIEDAQSYIYKNNILGEVLNLKNVLGIFSNNNIIMGYTGEDYYLQFKNGEDRINLNKKLYRNVIQINVFNNKLSAINILDLEEYLYGVVPSEMPSSWHKEALKAQSVAARNYTYSNLGLHSKNGYDVCDTTHCQVYKGVSNEKDTTTQAVNETRGILAYYKDKIINAVYSSSNGGYSDNSENVWGNKEEYLRAIKDEHEEGAKIWERTFTFDELKNLAQNIGNINEVILEKDTTTGRAVSLKLLGDFGEKILQKEDIRTFFSKSAGGSLESRNFNIKNAQNIDFNTQNKIYVANKEKNNYLDLENSYYISSNGKILKNNINYILDKNSTIYLFTDIYKENTQKNNIIQSIKRKDTNSITFSGRGWGHGVGMSQYGANSLAKKGYKFDEILKYYYTGIEVR